MKNVKNLKKLMLYAGLLFLTMGIYSCSDDDDGDVTVRPTGSIQVDNNQTLSGNTLTVQSVTVGQDSWLAAVAVGDESTNNFIAQPVRVQKGTSTDVQLTFNENAITDATNGQQVVLKLYADNPTRGTQGQWDASDEPITNNNMPVTKTITVFAEGSGEMAFSDFDQDGDGMLDRNEVSGTYVNDFSAWDADSDGVLSEDEFMTTFFGNTDADDDDSISEDEWNQGYSSMFGNYFADGDFANLDTDGDGMLSSDEWNTALTNSDWFTTYDADADTFVSDTEWDEGLFLDWDMDDDDFINEDEYNNYRVYTDLW